MREDYSRFLRVTAGLTTLLLCCLLLPDRASAGAMHGVPDPFLVMLADTVPANDTIRDRQGNFIEDPVTNPFDLQDPASVEQNVEYDPVLDRYIITEKVGEDYFRAPTYMTFEEYLEWSAEQEKKEYFQQLAGVAKANRSGGGKVDPIAGIDISKDIINRLFGGTEVDIRPQGNVDMTFGWDYQKQNNPILPVRQQRTGGFDFDMDIQVNVDGKIGEKLNTSFNYNTRSTFDFENQLKLDYNSQEFGEDDIIQKIEAGDISLPLRGSLIQGAQKLFGLKTELQFGHLRLTAIASQQRSEKNDIVIQGGSVLQEFEIPIDEYVQNRNFFLAHFNRETFEGALGNLPQINSLFRITRMEVWITNDKNQTTNVRDIVAISDIGESRRITPGNESWVTFQDTMDLKDICKTHVLPANEANGMLEFLQSDPENRYVENAVNVLEDGLGLEPSRDYEKIRARRLSPTEFNYHPDLGYISLNINVQPDQVLGVAFEFTYNGIQFRVGELSDVIPVDPDNQSALFVKMLKSTVQRVDLPIWDLMMKNFYRVGAGDLDPSEFELDVFFEDPGEGFKRFLPEETGLFTVPLLNIFNLDNLNAQGDPQPDGRFDFVESLTIYPRAGYMMFPVLEPFGTSLKNTMEQAGTPGGIIDQYIYQELYDSTLFRAQEFPEKNRFTIKGESKSSTSSDISLGTFNIPPGSVRVTAGGQTLTENVDYTIDYNIGRLKIINESFIQPGTPIRVSFEDNALFSFQKKTMLGLRADYDVNDNLFIGGTFMNLFERPYTQKVNIGDDPINNKVYGLDLTYSDEAPWLTRFVDKIPGLSTKAPSAINFQAEFAALQPGHSKAINGNNDDKNGVVYIDDFEGSSSALDMRIPENRWQLASIPQDVTIEGQDFFDESDLKDDLNSGVNRALFNWYRIDRSIRTSTDQDNPYTRAVNQQEIFPGQTPRFGTNDFRTFDVTFYPDERGPYNFDLPDGTTYSKGLNDECGLNSPKERWGGIQRQLNNTDFEQANFEALEFWMLDPYIHDTMGNTQLNAGYLVFNLGNISEDMLKDGRLAYEHGLPRDPSEAETDYTNWGRIPKIQPVVNAFSNDVDTRIIQDVGQDGLNDEMEREFYSDYVEAINASALPLDCKQEILQDPSNDNFVYFDDPIYDQTGARVLERYKGFNGTENNSPPTPRTGNISANTNIPNNEDLNGDLSLQEGEQYYQYVIKMVRLPDGTPDFVSIGQPQPDLQLDWVQDAISGSTGTWYRFRIPLDQGHAVGGIQGFRSIRFMRMYMTGYDQKTTLRFATLDLVRNQWRRYTKSECIGDDNLSYEMDKVNVEENSAKTPFPYVVPAGIQRERIVGSTFQDVFQNEQSLVMRFCGLQDECDVRVFKQLDLDMRVFDRLQMFSHLEAADDMEPIGSGELKLFIRLGSDFEQNYYEYELPLTPSTDPDAVDLADEVWKPDSNDVDFALSEFTDLKIERNASGLPIDQEYEQMEGVLPDQRYRLRIRGNPTLGYVRNVMIGVRNPSGGQTNACGEVWINELRVAGLLEDGGIAALARLDMDLADFGTVGLASTYSSIGYGAIDQKLDDRAKESTFQFDASAGLELGQFFGKDAGVRIPFYTQYSTTVKTPQFDPLDLDLELKEKLKRAPTQEIRDSVREQAEDVTTLTLVNLTNVRKEKKNTEAKPMPWDINNFTASYSYSNTKARNEVVENDQVKQHRAQLDYNYNFPNVTIEPLKNVSKSDWLKPITAFNFNPLPNSFSFNTTIDRRFGERSYRFSDPIFKTWFDKRFAWDRQYNLRWNFTKSITFDFNAFNGAVIDEPDEYVNRLTGERITKQERRDSIWNNIRDFGRTKEYQHDFRVGYRLPTNLFPALDWIRGDASYNAQYSWAAAALNTDSLGNIIQNGHTLQLTADLDFTRLYRKSKWLNSVQGGAGSQSRARDPRTQARDPNSQGEQDQKKERNPGEPSGVAKVLVRPLLMIRKLRLNYSVTNSTVVPGYNQRSRLFGMNSFEAPGWNFIAGLQPDIGRFEDSSGDWLDEIGRGGNEWIVDNVFQAQPILQNSQKTLDGRLTLEPFTDFKIDLDMERSLTNNFSMFYKNTDKTDVTFERLSPREVGTFSLTYFSMQTLFMGSEEEINELFMQFESYRPTISQERGEPGTVHDLDGEQYTFGFGRKQRDVIVPAFIAAYTNENPENFELTDMFDWIPRPNWQLTYNGLQKVGGLQNIFSSVRLSHGYKSVLTINSFETDLNYVPPQINDNNVNEASRNYYSQYIVPQLALEEEFSPLIGLDVRTTNDMSFNVNFAKRRGLRMGFVSNELAETRATTLSAGFQWTLRDVELGFLPGFKARQEQDSQVLPGSGRGRAPVRGNDLELLFDFSFTDNITVNHYLDQEVLPVPTRGSKDVVISPSIRYNLNKFINLRFFVDYRRSEPYTSTGYPITSMNGGLTVQVVLE